MELLVVGAGAMGRWFADVVDASVTFTDTNQDAARSAAADCDGRTVSLDSDERFDAVCIAVPMAAAADAIAAHAVKAERALFDVTGSMTEPMAAMDVHASGIERVSLHPLFAPERAPGNVAMVVDDRGPVTGSIVESLEERGNHVFETTPEMHDEAMETVQAKAHAAVLAFALAAGSVPEEFRTPVFDDLITVVDRVTAGEPHVYGEIQSTFDGAADIAAAAARIADADADEFEALYRRAGDQS